MRFWIRSIGAVAAVIGAGHMGGGGGGFGAAVSASPMPNGVVVERVGGSASFEPGVTVNGNATSVFLDDFNKTTASQALPQLTIALPVTTSGGVIPVTESGNQPLTGLITRTADGASIVVSGYGVTVGTGNLDDVAHVPRAIVTVPVSTGVPNIARQFSDGGTTLIRSAASDNGTRFWITEGNSVRFLDTGATTTTTLVSSTLQHGVAIASNQLFVSNSAIAPVGTGLPTTATTLGPPIDNAHVTTPIDAQFVFFDLTPADYLGTGLDTLYVADSNAAALGGGVIKWTFDGATWTRVGSLTGTLATGAKGLAGELRGGFPVLYFTTTETSANSLYSVWDNPQIVAPFSPLELLATAPANTSFRGVVIVPEPQTVAMLILAGAVVVARRRRMTRGVNSSP